MTISPKIPCPKLRTATTISFKYIRAPKSFKT